MMDTAGRRCLKPLLVGCLGVLGGLAWLLETSIAAGAQAPPSFDGFEYRILAANKTSTMEREMNEAAGAGFRFQGVMGGETAIGGKEVVTVMVKAKHAAPEAPFQYRLLATSKTSTMQKEIQQAGDAGFEYRGQTVFASTFGGKEVVVIMERDPSSARRDWDYRLFATSRTSTMQKELVEAGDGGFEFVGITVGETAIGGNELVVITRRPKG